MPGRYRPTGGRPREPRPSPVTSGPVVHEPACARPSFRSSLYTSGKSCSAADGSPDSICDRIRVTSLMAVHAQRYPPRPRLYHVRGSVWVQHMWYNCPLSRGNAPNLTSGDDAMCAGADGSRWRYWLLGLVACCLCAAGWSTAAADETILPATGRHARLVRGARGRAGGSGGRTGPPERIADLRPDPARRGRGCRAAHRGGCGLVRHAHLSSRKGIGGGCTWRTIWPTR